MSELVVGSIAGLAANSYVVSVASGSKLVQPGSVLQVVSTTKTDTFTTSSSSMVDITGLSASITPSSTSSKILVIANIYASCNGSGFNLLNLVRDSTNLALGVDGTVENVTAASYVGDTNMQYALQENTIHYVDSPASTSSLTYKIQMNPSGNTGTINRRAQSTYVGVSSTITLMEIAG